MHLNLAQAYTSLSILIWTRTHFFVQSWKKTRTIAGWCGLWHHFQGWLNTPVESPTVRVVDEGLLNADVSEPDVCFGGCISVIGRSYQILVVPFCLSNASMMPWRQGWFLEVMERFSVWRRSNKFAMARLLCQRCQQWLFDANGRSRKVSHEYSWPDSYFGGRQCEHRLM